ncbi:DUF1707 domain-containing protein [Corynebacterium sp. 21KM1197]|uniref:DUF1707 SHOCT-like domain-containing protein n=1 Tax=Corynebacterium sp. 21KM1197 TaxID=2989734 RepID=UPI0029CA3D0E|nr:DUF1707 domain-containing protein [Corynebacterium sp. 21KM1197]WPF68469.1 DUF1707 domain-containing protein [Corynebacterium sp. 21KM1197]
MNDRVRLSDDERAQAMSLLGTAFSQGRLGVDEYDARCQAAARAQYRYELNQLFLDLPSLPATQIDKTVQVYSAEEIEEARQASRYPKAGILALTSAAAMGIVLINSALVPVLVIIPIVFVLLYMLKIGPDSWYVPSQRALNRRRIQAIKAAERQRAIERRAQRLELQHELKNSAYNFARSTMQRRR